MANEGNEYTHAVETVKEVLGLIETTDPQISKERGKFRRTLKAESNFPSGIDYLGFKAKSTDYIEKQNLPNWVKAILKDAYAHVAHALDTLYLKKDQEFAAISDLAAEQFMRKILAENPEQHEALLVHGTQVRQMQLMILEKINAADFDYLQSLEALEDLCELAKLFKEGLLILEPERGTEIYKDGEEKEIRELQLESFKEHLDRFNLSADDLHMQDERRKEDITLRFKSLVQMVLEDQRRLIGLPFLMLLQADPNQTERALIDTRFSHPAIRQKYICDQAFIMLKAADDMQKLMAFLEPVPRKQA